MPSWIYFIFIFYLFIFQLTKVSAASMQEYWNGSAYFQKVTQWKLGTEGQNTFVGANLQTDIVVKNLVWYRFSREFLLQTPTYCNMVAMRILVSQSTDKGLTWSNPVVVVDPVDNTPWECVSADGDAYYDEPTNTWHYIFQCLARDNIWNLCYTKRVADSPMGQFSRPILSVRAGDIWKTLMGKSWADEGTPEIVQKIGNNFYITFHGFDGVRGYRGIARTTDFVTWGVDRTSPIYGPDNCSIWNVLWGSGGCVGVGEGSVLIDGGYYYQIIESMDKSLLCMQNQNWVFGIMRTANLTTPTWEYIPGNLIGIIYSTKQPTIAGYQSACAVQYARLFKDGSEIYLVVGRTSELPNIDDDTITGVYLYKLVSGAPFADYRFRENYNTRVFVQSDTVSRGNTEAKIENTEWLDPPENGLYFNGKNAKLSLPENGGTPKVAPVSITVDVQIQSLPSGSTISHFIAGKQGSYWLELYPSGNLCAFVYEISGVYKNACAQVPIGVRTKVTLVASSNTLQLGFNDSIVATTPIGQINPNANTITLGSLGQSAEGYYGSFLGFVYRFQIFTYALSLRVPTPTITPFVPSPIPTKNPTSILSPIPKPGDLTSDGIVDVADLFFSIRNFVSIYIYNLLATNYGK